MMLFSKFNFFPFFHSKIIYAQNPFRLQILNKKVNSHFKYINIQLNLTLCTVTLLNSSCSSRELCLFTIALGITLKLAFEPIECRKLSDVDGNIDPSFKSRVVKVICHTCAVVNQNCAFVHDESVYLKICCK